MSTFAYSLPECTQRWTHRAQNRGANVQNSVQFAYVYANVGSLIRVRVGRMRLLSVIEFPRKLKEP